MKEVQYTQFIFSALKFLANLKPCEKNSGYGFVDIFESELSLLRKKTGSAGERFDVFLSSSVVILIGRNSRAEG